MELNQDFKEFIELLNLRINKATIILSVSATLCGFIMKRSVSDTGN